jgi:hypothetical protein
MGMEEETHQNICMKVYHPGYIRILLLQEVKAVVLEVLKRGLGLGNLAMMMMEG